MPKTPQKSLQRTTGTTRPRTPGRRPPSAPALPAAFQESSRAATARALVQEMSVPKPEDKAPVPEWRELPKLRKVCPTFSMLVGKRQGLAEDVKKQVKALDAEIGAALDMADTKSVRVDERRVTRVEPAVTHTMDKELLIYNLLEEGLGIETIKKVLKKSTKEGKRSAGVQISKVGARAERVEDED